MLYRKLPSMSAVLLGTTDRISNGIMGLSPASSSRVWCKGPAWATTAPGSSRSRPSALPWFLSQPSPLCPGSCPRSYPWTSRLLCVALAGTAWRYLAVEPSDRSVVVGWGRRRSMPEEAVLSYRLKTHVESLPCVASRRWSYRSSDKLIPSVRLPEQPCVTFWLEGRYPQKLLLPGS